MTESDGRELQPYRPGGGVARRSRRQGNLYRSVLREDVAAALTLAMRSEGLDSEIALVRALLAEHIAKHPDKLELTIKGMHLLVRMVTAQFKLSGEEAAELKAHLDELAEKFAAAIFREEAIDA